MTATVKLESCPAGFLCSQRSLPKGPGLPVTPGGSRGEAAELLPVSPCAGSGICVRSCLRGGPAIPEC